MRENIITVIVVFTAAIILVELYLHFFKGKRYYQLADVASNIGTLFLYRFLGVVAFGFIYLCYNWIQEHAAIWQPDINSPWAWVIGFIVVDFCHYWFHRTAHGNNFLWGIHQGHHSSEDFNMSTAVRKGIFQQWVDWPFFLPMALLGFPFLTMYLPLKGMQFLYQFWLHNKFVGKIPYIEKILVTPSAHRVHHAQNPQYLDKNHAGVFIIWDKLFGTYAEEKEPVQFGTTVPVRSANPIGNQFTWWAHLWRDMCKTQRWQDKLAIPFKETGWRPTDVIEQERQADYPSQPKAMGGMEKLYLILQLAALFFLYGKLFPGRDIDPLNNAMHAFGLFYLITTCWFIGAFCNRTDYAMKLEGIRLTGLLCFSGAYLLLGSTSLVLQLCFMSAALSLALYLWMGVKPTTAHRPTNDGDMGQPINVEI